MYEDARSVSGPARGHERIVQSLRARLGEGVDAAVIAAAVEAEFALYAGARVTQFVPILVERGVQARLCGESS